jgi:hypothetical protein
LLRVEKRLGDTGWHVMKAKGIIEALLPTE